MEKISGILPSSARVKAVDLKNSAPVRPGAPTFGRPVGTATQIRKDARTTAEKALAEHRRLLDARKGEEWKSEIAREITNRFFNNKTTSAGPSPETPTGDLVGIQDPISESEALPVAAPVDPVVTQATDVVSAESAGDDLDSPEVGRYLDVTA